MLEFLFHNKGDGTFEEVGLTAEIAVDGDGKTYAGMGVDFQDYDNDGLPDIVITNLANQKYALYRNSGDSSFTYASYMNGHRGHDSIALWLGHSLSRLRQRWAEGSAGRSRA